MKTHILDKERKAALSEITPDKLTISQIIPTIENMYNKGADDMYEKYHIALRIYAAKHNIPFNPGMINEIVNTLNSI